MSSRSWLAASSAVASSHPTHHCNEWMLPQPGAGNLARHETAWGLGDPLLDLLEADVRLKDGGDELVELLVGQRTTDAGETGVHDGAEVVRAVVLGSEQGARAVWGGASGGAVMC